MAVFIPELGDVRRAQAIVGGYTRSRLDVIAARTGNPMGAEVRVFDGAVALRAPGFPATAFFNRAYGFSDALIEAVPASFDWYKAGVGGTLNLRPASRSPRRRACWPRPAMPNATSIQRWLDRSACRTSRRRAWRSCA